MSKPQASSPAEALLSLGEIPVAVQRHFATRPELCDLLAENPFLDDGVAADMYTAGIPAPRACNLLAGGKSPSAVAKAVELRDKRRTVLAMVAQKWVLPLDLQQAVVGICVDPDAAHTFIYQRWLDVDVAAQLAVRAEGVNAARWLATVEANDAYDDAVASVFISLLDNTTWPMEDWTTTSAAALARRPQLIDQVIATGDPSGLAAASALELTEAQQVAFVEAVLVRRAQSHRVISAAIGFCDHPTNLAEHRQVLWDWLGVNTEIHSVDDHGILEPGSKFMPGIALAEIDDVDTLDVLTTRLDDYSLNRSHQWVALAANPHLTDRQIRRLISRVLGHQSRGLGADRLPVAESLAARIDQTLNRLGLNRGSVLDHAVEDVREAEQRIDRRRFASELTEAVSVDTPVRRTDPERFDADRFDSYKFGSSSFLYGNYDRAGTYFGVRLGDGSDAESSARWQYLVGLIDDHTGTWLELSELVTRI